MNRNKTTNRRLLTLLGELCNGTLSEADGAELESLMSGDSRARREYANYMALHACLYSEASTLFSTPEGALLLNTDNSSAPGGWKPRWTTYALAAALTGVAVFSTLTYSRWSGPADDVNVADGGDNQGDYVARITGTHNCLWNVEQSDPTIGFGSQLVAGQGLELREGLAEITFNDGATLLLEGPASFVVQSQRELAMHSGRLAAVVPKRARGFRLHTDALEVFDVNAEFGLFAMPSGATELHVFTGAVQADVMDNQGRTNHRLRLNVAEAARVNPVSTTVVEFPADEGQFVRNMLPSSGPQDGLLAYEGFRYPDGPLSAQNGGFGWAGPWFSIAADESAGPDSNRVEKGSLSAEGIVPLGNRALLAAQRNRIRRSLATSVGGVFDAAGLVENQDGVRLVGRDGNRIYLSFIQRVSETDAGFYGLELHRGDGNPNRVLCIGNGADGSGYAATSNVNVYGRENGPSLGSEDLEANFFVVKITFGVDNRDTLEIYRNPSSLRDEQACEVTAALHGNFAFDRISIANFDGAKTHEIDELRVGTHFLAVTGRWGAGRGRLMRQLTFREQQYKHDAKAIGCKKEYRFAAIRNLGNSLACASCLY